MRMERMNLLKSLVAISVFAAVGLAVAPAFASVPVSITQQGRLVDDGEPMTGTHDLEFALYDSASGGAVLWSDTVSADLGDDGVYTVKLGDSTQPIDSTLLQDGDVYLELTAGGETFSPRLEMTSVPFSALSQTAEVAHSVVDGGVTSDALAPGAVTSDALAAGAVGSDSIDSVSWNQITDIPPEVGDSSDTLASLTCSQDQVAVYDGSNWSCGNVEGGSDSSDTLAELSCAENQLVSYDGSNWVCGGNIDFGDNTIDMNFDVMGTDVIKFWPSTTYNYDYVGLHIHDIASQDPTVMFTEAHFDVDRNLRVGARSTFNGDVTLRGDYTISRESEVQLRDARLGVNTAGASFGATQNRPQASIHAKSDIDHRTLILESRNDVKGWLIGTGEGTSNFNFYYTDDVRTMGEDLMARIYNDTGEFGENSDERLKDDIQQLSGLLDDILQLEPISYRLKSAGPDGTTTYGFSAQQVSEVFPGLVRYDTDHDYMGLAYSNFGVLAIQAIREQQEIIDAQDSEIDELRGELDSMEERLSRLEAAQ